jgi:hypothetical protein
MLAPLAKAQTPSPVADALRRSMAPMTEHILLAAQAMRADKYDDRLSAREATFGEAATIIANYSSIYCERLTGSRDPKPRSEETHRRDSVVANLQQKFGYCRSALATFDDATLSDTVRLDGIKTKAAIVQELAIFWATRYDYLTRLMRSRGVIPPKPCIVAAPGGCDSGPWSCRASSPGTARTGQLTLTDGPNSVRSDGRGLYKNGVDNARVVIGTVANLEFFVQSPAPGSSLRSVAIDLDHPVPGDIGSKLGVIIADTNLELTTQWYTGADSTQHNLLDIPIGTTVQAQQMNVAFHINGVPHALQMGPQPLGHCGGDGSAMYGDGTSSGTIAHPTAGRWIIDLPVGSIGRLFDIHLLEPNAVNKGLYYVSMRYVIDK